MIKKTLLLLILFLSIKSFAITIDVPITSANITNNLPNHVVTNNYKYSDVFISGNVGIGTESPAYKLDVQGTANIRNNLIVTGNVGIGTSSPSNVLDIKGTSNDGTDLVSVIQSGTGRCLGLTRGTISTRPILSISQTNGIGGNQPALALRQADVDEIALGINNDGNITTYNFVVYPTGKTGIGVQYPQRQLSVSGDMQITGNAYISNSLNVSGNFTIDGYSRSIPTDTTPNEVEGVRFYHATDHTMRYYNGSAWIDY